MDDPNLADLMATTFNVPGVEFVLVDMTADTMVPTVACLALSDNEAWAAAAFGSATRCAPVEAARKALFEAAQIMSNCHGLRWTAGTSMAESEVTTLEALAVDLTTPDVAGCGFRTFKVIVPGAVDINGDVRYPYLGSPRIASVPAALGWPTHDDGRLNMAPCPLS